MWLLLACGVIVTGFSLVQVMAARRPGRRPDPVLAAGLVTGPFFCLLASNELINAATGQRPLVLTWATGLVAIAGGLYILYRVIRG